MLETQTSRRGGGLNVSFQHFELLWKYRFWIFFLSKLRHVKHNFSLVIEHSWLDVVRKYSFRQRTINEWHKWSTRCVLAGSVNIVQNPKKNFEVGGWVKCPIVSKLFWIFLYLQRPSAIASLMEALCLCSAHFDLVIFSANWLLIVNFE